jgi:hypothetical protein
MPKVMREKLEQSQAKEAAEKAAADHSSAKPEH